MPKARVSNPMANLVKYLADKRETTGRDLFGLYKEFGYRSELQLASDLSDLASTGSVYFDGWKLVSRTDTSAKMAKRIISNIVQPPVETQ